MKRLDQEWKTVVTPKTVKNNGFQSEFLIEWSAAHFNYRLRWALIIFQLFIIHFRIRQKWDADGWINPVKGQRDLLPTRISRPTGKKTDLDDRIAQSFWSAEDYCHSQVNFSFN